MEPRKHDRVRYFQVADDGTFPNSGLPMLVYSAVDLPGEDAAEAFERLFHSNGWGGTWRNGVYDFHHYHSTAHEVLAVCASSATIQLGGPSGVTLDVTEGQCLVIPAGVAHKRVRSGPGFLVVGAYPRGQAPDLCRGGPGERPAADRRIAEVALPRRDPVRGTGGPLEQLWIAPGTPPVV